MLYMWNKHILQELMEINFDTFILITSTFSYRDLNIINNNDFIDFVFYNPYFQKHTLNSQTFHIFLFNVWNFFYFFAPVRDNYRLPRFCRIFELWFFFVQFLIFVIHKINYCKNWVLLFFHQYVTIVDSYFFTVSFEIWSFLCSFFFLLN